MDIQNFKERAAQEYSEIDDLYIQSLGTDPLLHLENSIQVAPASKIFVDPKLILSSGQDSVMDIQEILSRTAESSLDSQPSENFVESDILNLSSRLQNTSLATLQSVVKSKKILLQDGDNAFYNSVIRLPEEFSEFEAVKIPELILAVTVYQPRSCQAKSQEFLVLGRQKLSELRQKIYCMFDENIMDVNSEASCGSFFFINGVFYEEQSAANSPCAHIIEWINSSENNISLFGQVKRESMFEKSFEDLVAQLHHPYVFVHQGGCEHLIIIKEVRLFHPADIQNKISYPIVTYQAKIRRRKCRICDIYSAKFVTVNDKMAPENPCYFCEQCFVLFHYDELGALLYSDFEVFKYLHE